MDVIKASRLGLGRKRMKPRKDRKVFSKTARKMRRVNMTMRGGTRL